jgi:hypothetical protein
MIELKKEYIKMRNNNKFDSNWFYQYYLEKGGLPIDVNTFQMLFQTRTINGIDEILNFIDKAFGLTLVINKENKVIKVVE